jgi:membrane protein DedA with SNARE-associated domain
MTDWIINTMNTLGYWGIGWLMFLENLFPPIPSELIMPLAGFTVGQGKMDFTLAVVAGVLGTIAGAFPWYYLGKLLGEERLCKLADKYGKWLGISGKDIQRSCQWFNRRGGRAVFLGRLVPGIRTLISIPAGIAEMPILPFTLYSTVGTILWVLLLTSAGYLLGNNYTLVEKYVGPLSKVFLGLVVLLFLGWLGRRWLQRRKASTH